MKNNKIIPYLYLFPSMTIITIVLLFPIIKNFVDSFFRIFGEKRIFIGFDNYKFLFIDNDILYKSLLANVKLFLLIPLALLLSIILSYVLFIKVSNYKIYQFIFFIPVILSISVTGIVFRYILRFDGILNTFLNVIHLNFLVKDWLGNPNLAMFSIVVVMLWKEFGFGTVLFMSQLLMLDKNTIEAAKIDGANSFGVLTRIVVPQLKPLIKFYVIYEFIIISSWTFGYIFVMTYGGPVQSTSTVEYSIFNFLYSKHLPGIASAMSIILFLFVFILIFMQTRSRMKSDGEQVL
ncbi:MAG: carbohydrate ABC transporter permease [Candidatus Humimicrobiaceae bacterium]